jgi:hypothetical protein
MSAKWTVKPRRGIAHLFRELLTDTDHGLLSFQHPMYRRLSTTEKREQRLADADEEKDDE